MIHKQKPNGSEFNFCVCGRTTIKYISLCSFFLCTLSHIILWIDRMRMTEKKTRERHWVIWSEWAIFWCLIHWTHSKFMWNIERVLRLANSSLRRCSVRLHNELFRFLRALTEHTKAVCKFMVIVRLFQLRTISLHHLLWTSASIDWECEFEDPKKIDNKIIAQRLPWTRYAANSSNSVEVPDFKR